MNPPIIHPDVDDEILAEQAYDRVSPELEAIAASEVLPINLDVLPAITIGLGALPAIAALLPAIQRELVWFDATHVTRLEDYAFTLSHTNTRYLCALKPPDELPALLEQGTILRQSLREDATVLAHRKLIDPKSLSGCKWLSGYKNVATELLILSTVLKDHWDRIEGRCAIDKSELDRAARLAARILRLFGLREQAPVVAAEWSDKRARAFTQYMRCYDQLRRAVTYVRWDEGDIDEIAPSLYGTRKRRANAPEQPAAPVTPSSPGGAGNTGPDGPFMQ